jgi:phenylalanyl-tRNA synthetase beta chain
MKGVVEAWARALSLECPVFSPLDRAVAPFDPAQSCGFRNTQGICGRVGCVDPALARAADLPEDLWLFSIDFEDCLKLDAVTPCYHEPSRYPPVKRDLAFVVGKRVSHAEIERRFWADGRGLVRSVQLFDVYEGAPVPEGQRSMAFSLLFQSNERSLLNEEVDELVDALARRLRDDFGAVLRDA